MSSTSTCPRAPVCSTWPSAAAATAPNPSTEGWPRTPALPMTTPPVRRSTKTKLAYHFSTGLLFQLTRWPTKSPSATAVGLLLIEMLFLKPLRRLWSFDVCECLSLKLIVSVDLINVLLKVFFFFLFFTFPYAKACRTFKLIFLPHNLHKSVCHEELYCLGSSFCFLNLIEFYVMLLTCNVHFKHVSFAVDLSLF